MRLVCGKCNCEMTVVYGYFSTSPMYYVCPRCKYKVRNADNMEE